MKAQPKDDLILLSWGRCIKRGLARTITSPLIVLNNEQLKQIIKQNKVIISLFNNAIGKIKDSVSGNCLFLLIEKQGFLISLAGNEIIKHNIKDLGLTKGMSFTEESIGTNAVSLAIELSRPVFIPPSQNYCYFLKNWYCFAIPLRISSKIIGYLEVSTIKEPMKKELIAITKLLQTQISLNYKNIKDRLDNNKSMLSERELTILRLLANGYTEKEAAEKIILSCNTIKYYKKKIFNKLDVNSTREAIIKAIKSGLLIIEDI